MVKMASQPMWFAAFDRRVLLTAGASFAAMAATTGIAPTTHLAQAQSEPASISALTWTESDHPDAIPDADGWITFHLEATFTAIAPNWAASGPASAIIQIALSPNGTTWTDPQSIGAAVHDAGQPDRDNRTFGALTFADNATWVRYRVLDAAGTLITVPDLAFACIDSQSGPLSIDAVGVESSGDGLWSPPVISRALWGADESVRFDGDGLEIWPPQYQTIEHIIIHHTATSTWQDPMIAIRAVYYYHAVERGWGDIGYNYLVDYMGNVYEGRAGGTDVVGGHAYQYAHGSSGIALLGSFADYPSTPEAQAGLVWITAWLAQYLDPWGTADFHEQPDLPTICGHRDVNDSACPGDGLYGQLDTIRSQVSAVLDGADPTVRSQFYPGDTVQVIVEGTNQRSGPGTGFDTATALAWGTILTITEPAASNDGYTWYGVWGDAGSGWVAGEMLALLTTATITDDGFAIGDEVVVATDMLNLRADADRNADIVSQLPNCPMARSRRSPADRCGPKPWPGTRSHRSMERGGWPGSISPCAGAEQSLRWVIRSL